MKRTLLAIVAAFVMMTSANAQRLTNIYAEATFITDQMIMELGLNSSQRNGILNINLSYLKGINSYRDIDAYGWQYRNEQIRRMLTARQWRKFRESYYFYRPIGWHNDVYVHNIYKKYPKHHWKSAECKPYHYKNHHKHHHKHYDKHYDKHHKKHHKHYDKHHKKHKYGSRDRW